MHRLAIVVLGVLISAVAPARAWCEAMCLAPAQHATSHCPSHDSSAGPVISAADNDDCPVIESARPSPARFDVQAFVPVTFAQLAPSAPPHPSTAVTPLLPATALKRLTPLRI